MVGGLWCQHIVVLLGRFHLTWQQLDIYGGKPCFLNSLDFLGHSRISLHHVRAATQVSSSDWILLVPAFCWLPLVVLVHELVYRLRWSSCRRPHFCRRHLTCLCGRAALLCEVRNVAGSQWGVKKKTWGTLGMLHNPSFPSTSGMYQRM